MTTADPYCSRSDVTRRLPPGTLMSLAGLSASSLAGTNAITYDGHGLETDDPVTVRALDGGTLSAPLAAGTVYYVRRLSNSAFELAATAGGSAIDLTTDSSTLVVARDPDFDLFIEFYSRWADTSLPAHLVPLGRTEPVHPLIRGLVADMVAERMFNVSGQPSSEAMKSLEVATAAQLARFALGLPLRGAATTVSTNLSVSLAAGTLDPRGWGSGTLP
jgi:hypothetical protein